MLHAQHSHSNLFTLGELADFVKDCRLSITVVNQIVHEVLVLMCLRCPVDNLLLEPERLRTCSALS